MVSAIIFELFVRAAKTFGIKFALQISIKQITDYDLNVLQAFIKEFDINLEPLINNINDNNVNEDGVSQLPGDSVDGVNTDVKKKQNFPMWSDYQSDIFGFRPLSSTIEFAQKQHFGHPWNTIIPSMIRTLAYHIYKMACDKYPISQVNAFVIYDGDDNNNKLLLAPLKASSQSRITIHSRQSNNLSCSISPNGSLMIDSSDIASIDQFQMSQLCRLIFSDVNQKHQENFEENKNDENW